MFEKIYEARKQCLKAMDDFVKNLSDTWWKEEKSDWHYFVTGNEYDFIKDSDDFLSLCEEFTCLFGFDESSFKHENVF